MNQVANRTEHATPEEAADTMRSLRAFSGRRIGDEAEMSVVQENVRRLISPAPRSWSSGRIATLLSHYFAANTDPKLMEAVAEDWLHILSGYPAWAISNACRWWMSRENPRKSYKPVPGDIEDRCHVEMERVRVAQMMVQRGVEDMRHVEPQRVGPSPEDAAERKRVAEEILRGFSSKGFRGD